MFRFLRGGCNIFGAIRFACFVKNNSYRNLNISFLYSGVILRETKDKSLKTGCQTEPRFARSTGCEMWTKTLVKMWLTKTVVLLTPTRVLPCLISPHSFVYNVKDTSVYLLRIYSSTIFITCLETVLGKTLYKLLSHKVLKQVLQ